MSFVMGLLEEIFPEYCKTARRSRRSTEDGPINAGNSLHYIIELTLITI